MVDQMNNSNYTKWVACWGNATSISDREISTYSKNLTLRYPVRMCFNGSKLRFHFSNLTGTENVKITKAFVADVTKDDGSYKPVYIMHNGKAEIIIPKGEEVVSDEVEFEVRKGATLTVSLYFADFTQMSAGTLVSGPLSKAQFAYGDFADCRILPHDLSKSTQWFYFLNTIDVLTEEKNHAFVCYGDSITAQSWPDYLTLRLEEEKIDNVSIIRRAVCGTRILRQYDCITYQAYGLKGETRFPVEMNVAGASAVLIQHGINDIIHPVGEEVNQFRPWSDLPKAEEMAWGFENLYVKYAKNLGLKVYGGTLLPIYGWRTYAPFRNELRNQYNDYIRNTKSIDGVVDFDKAVRNQEKPESFAEGFDSGDHLHPSEAAYKKMAEAVNLEFLK